MNEQLQPCRCGEMEHIYFQTPSFTRFGYRVGLVECNICGEVVSFVSKCMDHAEFCTDATTAWNARNELDQLRQRVAEADNLFAIAARDMRRKDELIEELHDLLDAAKQERGTAEAKLALAEQNDRRYHTLKAAVHGGSMGFGDGWISADEVDTWDAAIDTETAAL